MILSFIVALGEENSRQQRKRRTTARGRSSHFSEGGFPSGWSADIPVRSFALRDTEADKNVRAPKNVRGAHSEGSEFAVRGDSIP
jgi:hypothetical protein